MVVMLGVGFVPPPVQGVGNVVPGRADEVRPGSPAPSIATIPWVPPWQTPATPSAPWSPPWGAAPARDPLARIELEYVSPSACETVELCPRKWAFAKLDKISKGTSDAAQLGTDTHSQHDRYFKTGTPYDLTSRAGQLALVTSPMLPDRETPGLRVEQEIRFTHHALPGVWFGGKIDLNWEQPSGSYDGRQRRVVLDHKTSGRREYMKLTRDALLHHPQAPVYSMMFFTGHGQERIENDPVRVAFGECEWREWIPWNCAPVVEPLELRWNYVLTSSKAATPATEKSWHTITREEAEEAFAEYVVPHARKMLEIIDQANAVRSTGHEYGAQDVEAKPGDACFAFGGCAFRSICKADREKMSNQAPGSFMDRVGITSPGAAPGQGWTPPGQAAPPPPAQGGWTPPVQAAAPAQGYPHTAGHPPQNGAPAGHVGYGAAVNPPESHVQATPPQPDAAAIEKARKAEEKRLAKEAKEAAAAAAPVVQNVAGPAFHADAMARVMASIGAALAPSIMAGQCNPNTVAELSLAIVNRAVELGVK